MPRCTPTWSRPDEDGIALYRLDAERIEQPHPQGTIFLTDPKLDYQPAAGNHWTLTAQHGQMPEDARTAELTGNVHAEGLPTGADTLMRIDTDQLHLDMAQQLATSAEQRACRLGRQSPQRSRHACRSEELPVTAGIQGARCVAALTARRRPERRRCACC